MINFNTSLFRTPGRSLALPRAFYGYGQGVVWLSEVQCSGAENRLLDCRYLGFNIRTCTHSEDANVICTGEAGVQKGHRIAGMLKVN